MIAIAPLAGGASCFEISALKSSMVNDLSWGLQIEDLVGMKANDEGAPLTNGACRPTLGCNDNDEMMWDAGIALMRRWLARLRNIARLCVASPYQGGFCEGCAHFRVGTAGNIISARMFIYVCLHIAAPVQTRELRAPQCEAKTLPLCSSPLLSAILGNSVKEVQHTNSVTLEPARIVNASINVCVCMLY